jgi:hypothetical protein
MFTSLKVDILSELSRRFVPFVPNAHAPIPFETELFSGAFMFVLRSAPLDPYFEHLFEDE